jgi:hypothetical protein
VKRGDRKKGKEEKEILEGHVFGGETKGEDNEIFSQPITSKHVARGISFIFKAPSFYKL